MGRGLSSLQKRILEILPLPNEQDLSPENEIRIEVPMRPVEVLEALGLKKTNSSRASLSRSLAALHHRGLISKWGADVALQGRGYRYTALPRYNQSIAVNSVGAHTLTSQSTVGLNAPNLGDRSHRRGADLHCTCSSSISDR